MKMVDPLNHLSIGGLMQELRECLNSDSKIKIASPLSTKSNEFIMAENDPFRIKKQKLIPLKIIIRP